MSAHVMTLTTAQLVATTTTADAGGSFLGPFILALAAVSFGIFIALRLVATVSAMLEGLVRTALMVGGTVLGVVFLASIVGVTWLSRSIGA